MKFKNYIEVQSGIKDSADSPGTLDQVLTSTATGVAWVDPSTISAEAAKLVAIDCKNTSGATIAKGTPVYQTGTVGATDVIEIAPADALISSGSQPAIGLLQTTLNNNGFGKVVVTGELLNITTDPIDGLTPVTGQKVFLKSGGGLTLTKPTGAENGIQNLGLIGKVSGGSAGSITVSSIMRTNDVPNLPTGKIWVGDGNTIVSDTVFLDEPNGRMGIGTTSPDAQLEISNSTTTSGSGGATLRLTRSDNTSVEGDPVGTIEFYSTDADGPKTTAYIKSMSEELYGRKGSLAFGTSITNNTDAVEAMRIDSSGDVGIGVTNPDARIHALNSGLAAKFVSSQATGLEVQGGGNSQPIARFKDTSASEKVTISSTGNVGIGTTSPDRALEVEGNIRSNGNIRAYQNNSSAYYTEITANASWGYLQTTSPNFYINKPIRVDSGQIGSYNEDLQLKTGATERVRISNTTGNVGIGTTNPGDKLHVSAGAIRLDDFYQLRWGGTGTGIYGHSTQGLNFYTDAGTTRLKIEDGGNVGIGTTNPNAKLDVFGNFKTTKSGGNDGNVNIKNNLTSQLSGGYANVGAGDLVVSGYGTNEQQPAVVTLVNLDGSISANQDLGVIQFGGKDDNSGAYCNAQIIGTAKQAAGTGSSGGGHLRFLTATASAGASPIERMRITSDGNTGVGTTSPSAPLHVSGGGNSEVLKIEATSSPYIRWVQNGTNVGFLQFSGNNAYLANTSNGSLFFRTNNTDRVMISSTGNLGIGITVPGVRLTTVTQTPSDGPALGSATTGGQALLAANGLYGQYSGVSNNGNVWHQVQRNDGPTATYNMLLQPSGGNVGIGISSPSQKLHVAGAGIFTSTVTATNFILSSDRRLKTKITDLSCGNIDVNWKSFEMISSEGEYRTGVIAQELEQKHPEFVNTDDEGFKSVKYIDLLIAKIAELEARLEKLEK